MHVVFCGWDWIWLDRISTRIDLVVAEEDDKWIGVDTAKLAKRRSDT